MNNQPTPLKEAQVKKFIPGIAWFFLVLILICLPGSQIPTPETWLNDIFFDKWVHAGLFAVLSFLFMYPLTKTGLPITAKKGYFIKIALAVIIWGLTTECLQHFFIPDRSFDIFDWVADITGVLVAFTWCSKKYIK